MWKMFSDNKAGKAQRFQENNNEIYTSQVRKMRRRNEKWVINMPIITFLLDSKNL